MTTGPGNMEFRKDVFGEQDEGLIVSGLGEKHRQ